MGCFLIWVASSYGVLPHMGCFLIWVASSYWVLPHMGSPHRPAAPPPLLPDAFLIWAGGDAIRRYLRNLHRRCSPMERPSPPVPRRQRRQCLDRSGATGSLQSLTGSLSSLIGSLSSLTGSLVGPCWCVSAGGGHLSAGQLTAGQLGGWQFGDEKRLAACSLPSPRTSLRPPNYSRLDADFGGRREAQMERR